MYNTREEINEALYDGLAVIQDFVGNGYRPKSVIAGYMAAANMEFLARQEGIHVCQGNIWSQHGIESRNLWTGRAAKNGPP